MPLTTDQQAFLASAARAAKSAGHIFPAMAACEAADESRWGQSELARTANNLFGAKQQEHFIYGTVHIPTREYLSGHWITEDAAWVKFPDVAACFVARMNTLLRLRTNYPHYAAALAAATPERYVEEVSRSWSTNPTRAADCTAIYHAHAGLLADALK
jgi:flagellum-specific peptidoglycan hydrolase FlgJ